MARFHRYVGVHYSGRKGPGDPLPGLAVYSAQGDHAPFREYGSSDDEARFSRRELAEWLLARLMEAEPVVIGLDHAFSFPHSYMERNGLTSWHAFLDDFEGHWPTDRVAVRELLDDNPRTGAPDEYRLAGRWTAAPRGVFSWGLHQDSPAKAAHAGIPWLAYLRRAGEKVHMWPFDGWEVPEGKSVVAEVRPARFVHRYPHEELSQEDLEARATALWLQERDRLDLLTPYFTPPLSETEKERATLEGWILGVA